MILFRPFAFVVVLATTGWCFAQEQRGFYKHFEGTINQKHRIQMDLRLMRVPYDGDSVERFEGFYHYESKGILLNLTGQYRDGSVELEAYSAQGGETTERFTGHISEKGAFSGTWRHQDQMFPFSLQETYSSGSIGFRPVVHTSSIKLRPGHPHSPTASSYREFLLPTGSPKPPRFLFDSLAAV
ncbi:MAG: hypothetical protein MUD08_16250, partial [Cytophagales bacterium]|nr:hypothetical protein [Cytophagales bacterium]